jgi:hypothetical protein
VGKLRRILIFEGAEGRQDTKHLEESEEGVVTSDHVEGRVLKERDGQSEFSVENLRSPVSH